MPIIKYNPTTATRRFQTIVDRSELSTKRPTKSLVKSLRSHSGRDSQGHVSIRHRGKGVKRLYRMVDFKQNLGDDIATVEAIEYDPNRTAWIALTKSSTGKKSYILAPSGLKAGDTITSSPKDKDELGTRLALKDISIGQPIYNLELYPGGGGKIVRSAGVNAVLMSKDENNAMVKLPSSEIRKFNLNCLASIGMVSNIDHNKVVIGKAGRNRLKGIRPTVRGKAMHPAAHPHGGGEAQNSIGLKYPKTPWGKIAIGGKTRIKHKPSNVLIVTRRKTRRRK